MITPSSLDSLLSSSGNQVRDISVIIIVATVCASALAMLGGALAITILHPSESIPPWMITAFGVFLGGGLFGAGTHTGSSNTQQAAVQGAVLTAASATEPSTAAPATGSGTAVSSGSYGP